MRITEFERLFRFTDTMVSGAFARFDHRHRFEPIGGGTLMRDLFDYTSPLGALGQLADLLFLERYMRTFLVARDGVIKSVAETEQWRRYLP